MSFASTIAIASVQVTVRPVYPRRTTVVCHPGKRKNGIWGRPLPGDVVYYDLPPQVIIGLGTPPAGQKYVRVASDILLITIGTGMVLDAIQDLNRL